MKPQVTKHGRLIRPVSESARIDIAKVIADFQASDEQGMSQIYLNGAYFGKFRPDCDMHSFQFSQNTCFLLI